MGRENFEVLKCCDNIKIPSESNSPLNLCIPRYQDEEEFIDCPFAICGCNFRTTELAQLNNHNEENIHRHMNVSFGFFFFCFLKIQQRMEREKNVL